MWEEAGIHADTTSKRPEGELRFELLLVTSPKDDDVTGFLAFWASTSKSTRKVQGCIQPLLGICTWRELSVCVAVHTWLRPKSCRLNVHKEHYSVSQGLPTTYGQKLSFLRHNFVLFLDSSKNRITYNDCSHKIMLYRLKHKPSPEQQQIPPNIDRDQLTEKFLNRTQDRQGTTKDAANKEPG